MKTVEKTAKKRKTDIFKKARTIAQTTFDLSDMEVDDFMMGRADRIIPAYATTGMVSGCGQQWVGLMEQCTTAG